MTITYVTITYNAAQVLQRTLDSVLQQDYPDIVHLIIDGASNDGTLQLIDDYIQRSNAADNGHRVQVTSEPDHGIYDAMNKGLRSLDGDYVCFLNAGDFLPSPDTVSSIVSAVSQRDGSFVTPADVTKEPSLCDTAETILETVSGEGRKSPALRKQT